MKPVPSIVFWKTFIWSTILMSLLAIYQTTQQILDLGIALWHSNWIFLLSLFVFNIIAGASLLRKLTRAGGASWIDKLELIPTHKLGKLIGLVLIAISFCLVWVVRYKIFKEFLPQVTPVFWVFLWASLFLTLGLKLLVQRGWPVLFILSILVQGLIYQVYGHFTGVSDYPFSIGYSEAGRYYYASLFFARSLYGFRLPLPFLHPTRYFLMSIPFLVRGLPLWFFRLWQALLWIGLTAAAAVVFTRRLRLDGMGMQFFITAWAFLYFLQGAVYYHLQVCVIFILAGVSSRFPWRSLLFISAASFWAGMSRINWFPVPAMLAISIYLLGISYGDRGWRYWITPLIWGSGIGIAFASQILYIWISGNADVRVFGSSFTSDLLWNRLLPNNTFPLGILPGISIISAPLIIAIYQMVSGRLKQIHPFRWLALLAIALMLFLGGLVVSVKIGGGADLHNMDAFMVLLALVAGAFFAGRVASEGEGSPVWGQIHWNAAMVVLLVPIGFAIPQIGNFHHYDSVLVDKDIQKLQESISEAVNSGGEVLFVTERQLITFDNIRDVPLIPEYEQLELMEMAMSGNHDYLERYYSDLNNHCFALVIAEEQKFIQQKSGAFIEENNAWVRFAGAPLLCAYKPIATLSSANVQIFVPRPNKSACIDPFLK